MNKFEKLIEYIINDEDQKARELFHDIVVEKSRDIYESIMDEESMEENVAGNQVEDMVDEISTEEAVGEDEEAGEEFELGGDDEEAEEQGDEFGAEEGHTEEDEIEDKVMNIDAKLDELLAKFDEIMGDDDHEEMPAEEPAMDMGAEMGAEEQPEEAMYEGENPFAKSGKSGKSGSAVSGKSGKSGSAASGKSGKSATELMREYVETVGDIYGGAGDAAEGDAVGSTGKKTSVNTKPGSVGPGADFGGTAVTSKGGAQNQDGTSAPSTDKAQEIKSGNVNVPGGKAAAKPAGVAPKTGEESGVNDKPVQKQNTGSK